jgi:hypothetical protein
MTKVQRFRAWLEGEMDDMRRSLARAG